MEEKSRIRKNHKLTLENRSRIELTGVTDVVSFDPAKVILNSEFGNIIIKGQDLHVSHLLVEQGELSVNGHVDVIIYDKAASAKSKESLLERLLR